MEKPEKPPRRSATTSERLRWIRETVFGRRSKTAFARKLGMTLMQYDYYERRAALRKYREDRYQKLCDAVYKRRGWTSDGIPTLAKVRALGIDQVEGLVELLRANGVTE